MDRASLLELLADGPVSAAVKDLRQGRCDRRAGSRRGSRILHQPRCLGHVKSHHLFPEYESETKLPQWGGFVSLFFGYQEVLLCMMY